MKSIIIQNIDLKEFDGHLRQIIREELSSLIHSLPKQEITQDTFLSKKAAAGYLRISTVTLSKYVQLGHVKAHRLAGSRLKFKRSELDNAFKALKNGLLVNNSFLDNKKIVNNN